MMKLPSLNKLLSAVRTVIKVNKINSGKSIKLLVMSL